MRFASGIGHILLVSALALLVGCQARLVTEAASYQPAANAWYEAGQSRLAMQQIALTQAQIRRGSAKNVILFVGDGMGISTVTAARILEGQSQGGAGEEHQLSFGAFPFSGLVKTYNTDAQTPDSAGTMTAIVSGIKTDAGVLGLTEEVERGRCDTMVGRSVFTALELAELGGMATGIVSTARLTHATPAATYAKSVERDWEDDAAMPAAAKAAGCVDIAAQLVGFEAALEARASGANIDGIEVMLGGGRRHFLPVAAGSEGLRTDGRNLLSEWQAHYPQGRYVSGRAELAALQAATDLPVLGLFSASHMDYATPRAGQQSGQPSLPQMTAKAIELLATRKQGFFLMVEAGRIDHAHHAGNAFNALHDTVELAEAVAVAVKATNPTDTLIMVTADHSHVFTMAGYPRRGNPILGKVVAVDTESPALAADGLPYTTLAYANGRGSHDLKGELDADKVWDEEIHMRRADLTTIDTTQPGYHQEALIPLEAETHGGEDVGVYAVGPGAPLVTGVHEQSYLFHVLEHAADLRGRAGRGWQGSAR